MSSDTIQIMLRQLRDGFLGELPERFDRLETLILAMEGGPDAEEAFREAFRMAHSIKGSGGTHGLHILTTICHSFEDALQSSFVEGVMRPGGTDQCLAYLDLLRTSAQELAQGREDFAPVMAQMAQLQTESRPKVQRILLLEPSRLSATLYHQGLDGLPLDIVQMGDGYSALHRLLKEPFRLLITANELEMLNGPALLSALRLSNSSNVGIKAILISSSLNKTTDHGRRTDADLVLAKDGRVAQNLRKGVVRLLNLEDR